MLGVGVHVGLAAEQARPILRARVLDRLGQIGGIGVIWVELAHVVVGNEPAHAAEVPAPVGPVGHQGVVGRIVREREVQVVDDVELHFVAGDQVLVHRTQARVQLLVEVDLLPREPHVFHGHRLAVRPLQPVSQPHGVGASVGAEREVADIVVPRDSVAVALDPLLEIGLVTAQPVAGYPVRAAVLPDL